ncbi:TIGR03032 family protein [Tropicibacter naphthalenivorans]|uniref:Conserved hypothetical protein CHP03032 domain-containing protein n=1 Tax=Tropicibacter naphthalenivorans TaxID=441103 RepID=A0A0P1G375_9RHOB|nr:TIGR03032 family protein [Tropicibacter naphthalenivorans]CUH76282.1 hypothetical protein TRN7648_00870 [Tropicibacter naphthalenivorans]SMC38960.1 TIGR03032 family protein [Tropicibacter naphthalenivorans]
MDTPGRSLVLESDDGFPHWLRAQNASLVFTAYRTGEVVAVGSNDAGLTASHAQLPRPMGISLHRDRLWVAGHNRLWRFQNFLAPGQSHDGFDAIFVPQSAHVTGALDIHDIAEDATGAPVFVATHLNALARLSPGFSYAPLWQPPFVTRHVLGDRCHLNGMAMEGGRPRFVTCVAATDTPQGWREQRVDGGVVLEVPSGKVLCAGLSMPHSPRLGGGRLWLLDSGTGRLGWIDPAGGDFTALCTLPGFARGLSVNGDYAVVGLSRPRAENFDGLRLDAVLAETGQEAICAVLVIDLRRGETLHRLSIGPDIEEIYDVGLIHGVRCPRLIGPDDEELSFFIRPDVR